MAEEEDKKPTTDTISIRIHDQSGEDMFFKVKKTTKLEKVFIAYSQRKGFTASSVRFLFDGARVRPDQRPEELGMDDGDLLDCMLAQNGGCI